MSKTTDDRDRREMREVLIGVALLLVAFIITLLAIAYVYNHGG